VALSDLYTYSSTFGAPIQRRFGENLIKRKKAIELRTGKDITSAYKQVLGWRHAYAHAGIRNTTIEEALATHRFAKRVLYVFDDAFTDVQGPVVDDLDG
jgi:hypothetical protein